MPLCLRQAFNFHHRSNLDGAKPGGWNSFSDVHRLIEIAGLDQIKAAELLAGLGKWSIGHHPFPVTHADACRGGNRMQWAGSEIVSTCVQVLRQASRVHITMFPFSVA